MIKVEEKTAEVTVLKEMLKSSNQHVRAKDIDLQRLNKKLLSRNKSTDLSKPRS